MAITYRRIEVIQISLILEHKMNKNKKQGGVQKQRPATTKNTNNEQKEQAPTNNQTGTKQDPSAPGQNAGWESLYTAKAAETKMDPSKAKAFVPQAAKPTAHAKAPPQYEDDAIVSISKPEKVEKATNNKAGTAGHAGFSDSNIGKKTNHRELTKTDWVKDSTVRGTQIGSDLNDCDKGKKYDQFANKNSTYKESLYNTTYDIKKFSKQQI